MLSAGLVFRGPELKALVFFFTEVGAMMRVFDQLPEGIPQEWKSFEV